MSKALRELALELEDKLPRVMRTLYRPDGADPLRDLPVAQLRLVRVLYPLGKSHSEASEELGISISAVTQVANRLEGLGLVQRVEQADRRIKHLRLTAQGNTYMSNRIDFRVQRTMEALATMPEEARSLLVTLLEDLIRGSQTLWDEGRGPVIASELAQVGALPLLGGEATA
jgi:DNA-binding MarR family transcriptional regulator